LSKVVNLSTGGEKPEKVQKRGERLHERELVKKEYKNPQNTGSGWGNRQVSNQKEKGRGGAANTQTILIGVVGGETITRKGGDKKKKSGGGEKSAGKEWGKLKLGGLVGSDECKKKPGNPRGGIGKVIRKTNHRFAQEKERVIRKKGDGREE